MADPPTIDVTAFARRDVLLLERGAFTDVDAAMMVHPTPVDVAEPRLIAAATLDIEYTGKPSHAAMYPELGVNAADALTVAQVAIGLLRQHVSPTDRIHGIVLHGGDAPNIIPARTVARHIVRSLTIEELNTLLPRVIACFEAGARATGCEVHIGGGTKPYADMEALGRRFPDMPELSGDR